MYCNPLALRVDWHVTITHTQKRAHTHELRLTRLPTTLGHYRCVRAHFVRYPLLCLHRGRAAGWRITSWQPHLICMPNGGPVSPAKNYPKIGPLAETTQPNPAEFGSRPQ